METMENKLEKNKPQTSKGWFKEHFTILLSLVLVIVMLLAVVSPLGLFTAHDAPFQLLAACLGAIVTVLITSLLLKSQAKQQHELQQEQAKQQYELQQEQISAQREADENKDKKDKENQLREKKIESYSDFISSMYSILNKKEDEDIEESDWASFRETLFSKLVFYIKPESLSVLKDISEDFQKIDKNDKVKLLEIFSSITSLLRDDLNTARRDESDTVNTLMSIWSNLSIAKTTSKIKVTETPIINTHYSFWHFNMWGDEQIFAFRNGLYELSLMEYNEETWRTNLVQQVENGDIVFLFRRGGWGYIGAFKVRGWRVFYNDGDSVRETIYLDGNKPFEVSDDEQVKKDIIRYDFYNSISDGADSCANIIVEPFAFDYEGVSYPGGVYRRTISRYDSNYARTLLSRFAANQDKASYNMLWDEKDGQKGYITKIDSNTEFFEKIVQDLMIKPAEKDDNGNWK